MKYSAESLIALKPEKAFFIGIDSDGCAFDTMEIKHKECFCPAFINHFELQAVSKYARETWEFVNLYSRTRGTNRFKALKKSLELLKERNAVKTRKVVIPEMKSLARWIATETKLGNPSLKTAYEKTGDPELGLLYRWSIDVNNTVEKIVRNVAPFPYVRESLEKIRDTADAVVVSQSTVEALNREWTEHEIDRFVNFIAGQEIGTKTEHIRFAAGNKYEPDKILMIGDAPGDLKAAKDNGALYFPIVPGQEEKSWERFYSEGLEHFISGNFAGDYESSLIENFFTHLPENPPWRKYGKI